MKKQDRQAICAVLATACVLLAGAFAPAQPRAAWWCTAFAVAPAEAAEDAAQDGVEYRCWLADWLRSIFG